MTYEEAKERIEKNIKRNTCIPKDRDWWNNVLDMTLETLDKQIPKKLVDYEDNSNELIGYSCPRCNAFYSLYGQFIDSNYCPNCGQRVYVEGDEE